MKLKTSEIISPMPLKKVFSLDDAIIWETRNAKNAKNRKIGLELLNASFKSLNSTFVETKYKDNPVIVIFNRSLVMFQIFFLSIKNSSNLVSFSVCSFKVGAHINFC